MRIAMLWVLGMVIGGQAAGQGVEPQRVALVELFTSEGCSSCPPADALLKKLDGMKTGGGVLIVGLSEHVTYWNNLGWKDPFSQEMFTQRQRGYGERFRLDSVYTPQVVVNGERQVLGSDRGAVVKAAEETGRVRQVVVRINAVVATGKSVVVSFALSGVAKDEEVFAVVADDADSTEVRRGENGGRTLAHVSVARSLVRVGAAVEGARTVTLEMPEGAQGRHVVVFVQEGGMGKVLGAGVKGIS